MTRGFPRLCSLCSFYLSLTFLLFDGHARADYDEIIELKLVSPVNNFTYNYGDEIDTAFVLTGAKTAFSLGFNIHTNLGPVDHLARLDLNSSVRAGMLSQSFTEIDATPLNRSPFTYYPNFTSSFPPGWYVLEWDLRMTTCLDIGHTTYITPSGYHAEGGIYFTVQDSNATSVQPPPEISWQCPPQLASVRVSVNKDFCLKRATEVSPPPACDSNNVSENGSESRSQLSKGRETVFKVLGAFLLVIIPCFLF